MDKRPLVVHVVFRFAVGGLENGLVNLINRITDYRHAIVSLTDVTEYRQQIKRDDVSFYSLHKRPGHGIWLYPRLFRLFRELAPAVVHTRNLAALEAAVPAWLASVPVRIHGEHGWDVHDPDGTSAKYQAIRRAHRPFVTKYIALSRDLRDYLLLKIAVPERRVAHIYNGVDTDRFRPRTGHLQPPSDFPFSNASHWIVGTVGRMQSVKNQAYLARAFIQAVRAAPEETKRMRLVLIGDGPLREECRMLLANAGLIDRAWLPGERSDIPALMRHFDCFVLPSRAEGICNTILEAMATGLPVIATSVGGNAELVEDKKTGYLVPVDDPPRLAERILGYGRDSATARAHGVAGRMRAEQHFALDAMASAYRGVYDEALAAGRADARRRFGQSPV